MRCGACGSGIVSSVADVVWTCVCFVGCEELVEYVRCVCVWLGVAWVESGLGLGFTNPVGTGECWTCVCFGCGGVGG